MLDTDCCIDVLRGKAPRVVERIAQIGLGLVHISTITVGELLVGAARSKKPNENTAIVVQFCASLQIVAFDDRAAASYAQTRATLESRGAPIGPMDMLIAGHALALDATLVTGNVREFRRVDGLRVENWLRRMS